MKNKILVCICAFVILIITIGVIWMLSNGNESEPVLNIPSSNSVSSEVTFPSDYISYNDISLEIYTDLENKYKDDEETADLYKIVAYINDSPIYRAEAVELIERLRIYYNEYVLPGQTVPDVLKKYYEATENDMIIRIAKNRLVIQEGERLGYFISDEDVNAYQKELEIQNTYKSAEVRTEIEKQYNKLYQKLGITKEEYNSTYDYLYNRYDLLSAELLRTIFKDDDNDQIIAYYDDLFAKADFRMVE